MGQRLVIEIQNNKNKTIATAYYHWSGFTKYAIELTKTVLEEIDNSGDYIQALKHTNAKLPNEENRNRNDGLIDIEKDDMQESIRWAEQLVKIVLDIDNKIRYIDTEKLFYREVYIDDFEKYKEFNKEDINIISIDYISKSNKKTLLNIFSPL